MKIIALINQKGGVAKSSTALALHAGLTERGYKVLGVDLDAQGNFSYTSGAAQNGETILGVLTGETKIKDAIQTTETGDIIPSSLALANADIFLSNTGKEYTLKKALAPITREYDHIILDTPPALGVLTANALTACDTVIIPAQADVYSLMGINQLNNTIEAVREYCNPKLEIAGILLTRYYARAALNREMIKLVNQIAANINTKVFTATIREAVILKEAQINRKSIFTYAPKANITADYNAFIDELIGEGEHGKEKQNRRK